MAAAKAKNVANKSLFVENQGSAISPSRSRQPPVARKAPFQQSSSEESSSEVHTSEDCLMGELARRKKLQRRADRNAASSSIDASMLQPKRVKVTASATTSKTSKTSAFPTAHDRDDEAAKQAKQRSAPDATADGSSNVEERSTMITTTTLKSTTDPSSSKTTMRAIRTAPQKQTTRAINIIDKPAEQQTKAWSSDRQYNKLRYRGLAEKRSRTEGVPDFNALDFVNGPPPTLPKAPTSRSSGDPYGRRDITNARVQENDEDDEPRRGHDTAPLADWEVDKVPLMCNAWKLSSNCPHGARKCRFMHREYDPQGRPYKLGDYDGRIPQKYRKPPITCPFWYKGGRCTKTAEDCQYAHEDTGWAEYNGQPIKIEHLPESHVAPVTHDAPSHLIPFKMLDPPITCTFWLRDPHGCIRTEEVCKYAHWNTGWAPPEDNVSGRPVRIDPSLRPRKCRPKHADPPVTCHFWLRAEAGCTKTDDECKYAHWNTGWAPPGMGVAQAVTINPQQLPRSQQHRDESGVAIPSPMRTNNGDHDLANQAPPSGLRNQTNEWITCPVWLRDPNGCPKSDEACGFAHRNTGWATPKGRPSDPPVKLDPKQIPRFHRDRMGTRLEPKYGNPPVTCASWLRNEDGCRKTDEDCRFAHNNTGWLPEYGERGGPTVKIDGRERPRYDRPNRISGFDRISEPDRGFEPNCGSSFHDQDPKKAKPPITCYFWLEGLGGCAKTTKVCRFAHRNTGWIQYKKPGQPSRPEQIDPKRVPRFRKYGKCSPDSRILVIIKSLEPASVCPSGPRRIVAEGRKDMLQYADLRDRPNRRFKSARWSQWDQHHIPLCDRTMHWHVWNYACGSREQQRRSH